MTKKSIDLSKKSKLTSSSELEKEIAQVVDRIITCPANQLDGLIRRLKSLWKKRHVVLKVASSPSPTKPTTAPSVAAESPPHMPSGEERDSTSPCVKPIPVVPSGFSTQTTETDGASKPGTKLSPREQYEQAKRRWNHEQA